MSKSCIIHLRSTGFFGGPERAILGQCLSQSDFDFVCASFVRGDAPNTFLEKANQAGLETARIVDSFAGDFRVIRQIRQLLKRTGTSLLVSHDYKANFFGRLAVQGSGVRQIAHFRGRTAEDQKVRLYNFIDGILLRRMSRVLAVSEKSGQYLEDIGVSAEAISIVPNAIENEKLAPVDFHRQADPDRPRRLVAAGRLSYEKGYDVLLDAVALIHNQAPSFTLHIYGHGLEEKGLKESADRLGITDVILFEGFVDDILPVFRQSDFLVLPSRSEGMPNVILEAWSQKLGVLSTTVGGVPEMITHGSSGLMVPPENPEALAEQLLVALANPEEMIHYGQAGYQLVQDKYNYHKQALLLKDIYGLGR